MAQQNGRQQQTIAELALKVSEMSGMIAMIPKQEASKQKMERLKVLCFTARSSLPQSEKEVLNERLAEAQNEIAKLKQELKDERKKREEAALRPAAGKAATPTAPVTSKPERSVLDAGIQALVCLIVFLVGFFVATRLGSKRM